jgi:hypothetical protein
MSFAVGVHHCANMIEVPQKAFKCTGAMYLEAIAPVRSNIFAFPLFLSDTFSGIGIRESKLYARARGLPPTG